MISHCEPHEAQDLSTSGQAIILDVRGTQERAMGHIPESLHIPLHELPARFEELPKDQLIVCQCASGGRSAQATGFLAQQGFRATNLSGGIGFWNMSGLPVTR